MDILIMVVLFWFGAIFGSFAGAVAWRLKNKKDFVRGRSECEQCHHTLAPLDLVPIVSWVVLRGKCRYCKQRIGNDVLLLELGLGTAFALSYISWPLGFGEWLPVVLFGIWLAVLVVFAILFVYDLRWTLLPDRLVFPLIALALVFFAGRMVLEGVAFSHVLFEGLLALTPIAGLYALLYFVSNGKWVGFGDVKLGIALGLLLGWQQALLALVLANFIGLLFVLPGLVRKKLKTTSRVPFGPCLMAATFAAFLYGSQIIRAYMNVLLA